MDRPVPPAPAFFALGDLCLAIPIYPPLVMGIVNVTPDSFSDGGDFLDADAAVAHARQQMEEAAGIIDIGGESTRPGAEPIAPSEQLRRVLPVIEKLRAQNPRVVLSIDTTSAEVASAAILAGATMVNDTSALRDDPRMAEVVCESKVAVVLMHRKGTPRDMQLGGGPHYRNVVKEVLEFFHERIDFAVRAGIDRERIVVDPGIGFGKRTADNLQIIRELPRLIALGFPVLIGASRKRFIGEILDLPEPRDRLIGSLAVAAVAALCGAALVRVHDVGSTVQAVKMAAAIRSASIAFDDPA